VYEAQAYLAHLYRGDVHAGKDSGVRPMPEILTRVGG
jgi:hypothetical protein